MGIVEVLTLYLPSACALALAGLAVLQRGRIRALRTRISDAARSDPLTGLLNRRSFDELLDLEVERARRTGRPLSVLFGDLDNFAYVNEEQGHEAADAALELVARDLGKWKRRIDRAARIGGDEFALLLPETDEHGAHILAERLRRATHRSFGDAPVPLTICFGVASHPCHGGDSATLMRSAERAMLAAKQFGRDRSVVYSADVPTMLGVAGAPGDLQLATVIALAEALDIRDTGTAKHSHMVGRYAELMATELELESAHVERVRLAGVLHDVGKIGVSDAVLSKPGPLSADEWVEMKTHPEIAARLLSRPEFDDVRALDPRPPRAARRGRLSIRPGARADSARGAHPGRGRRVRSDDRRSCLPPRDRPRGGARGARGGRGHAVRRRGGGGLPRAQSTAPRPLWSQLRGERREPRPADRSPQRRSRRRVR